MSQDKKPGEGDIGSFPSSYHDYNVTTKVMNIGYDFSAEYSKGFYLDDQAFKTKLFNVQLSNQVLATRFDYNQRRFKKGKKGQVIENLADQGFVVA